ARFRPKLADWVELKEFHLKWGNDYAMIANTRDLVHYRLEPGEADTVKLMDGTRTVKEIVVERFQESGDLELQGVADLVYSLFVHVALSHRFSLSGQSLAIGFLVLMALNYFTVFVHEMGHALVVVHYGRRLPTAGFQIYFGTPAFFVESSDALMLERKQRMLQ